METKVRLKPRKPRVKVTLTYKAACDLQRLLLYVAVPSLLGLEDGLDANGISPTIGGLEWIDGRLTAKEAGNG